MLKKILIDANGKRTFTKGLKVAIKYLETIYIHPVIKDKMIAYAESRGFKNVGSIAIIAKNEDNRMMLMVEGGGLDLRPLFQFPLSEVLPEGWHTEVKFNNKEPQGLFKLLLKKIKKNT